ncbi:MAG: Uma2 family endonuclease, partial [Myxococcota bacterium]
MAQGARHHFSFADYARLEERSEVKHEFLDGAVWAMAGGSPAHAATAANVVALLSDALRDRACRVFSSDLRVRVPATGLGTYPDVSVVCDALALDPEDPKGHTVTNPALLVEVLSPTTESYDRGEKPEHYQALESLQALVLIAQDERRVDVIERTAEGGWVETCVVTGDVALGSLGVSL